VKTMDKGLATLERVIFYLGIACISVSVILSFVEVVTRYLFDFSTTWIAEVSKYVVVYMVFLLAGPITKGGGHVRFSFLFDRMGKSAQWVMRLVEIIVGLVVALALTWYSLELVQASKIMGGKTESRLFYAWWTYTALPFGMGLLVLYYAEQLVRHSSTPKEIK